MQPSNYYWMEIAI